MWTRAGERTSRLRETLSPQSRSSVVRRIVRIASMVLLYGALALVLLGLATQAGVMVLQRIYPQQGKTIELAGAHLNLVDLGPRGAAGAPIVLLHGASPNLEAMEPSGYLRARRHREFLFDDQAER